MKHYRILGIKTQATAKEINTAYRRQLTTTGNEAALQQIKKAYAVLSNPFKRELYDGELLDKEYIANIDQTDFPIERDCQLLQDPDTLNHYEFVNRLFKITANDKEYLVPGRIISDWDKNRIYWQTQPILGALSEEISELEQRSHKTTEDKKRLALLEKNEAKIGLIIFMLTTGNNQQTLYDLSLGPKVVPQTAAMRELARLIGGWERIAELEKRMPDLRSVTAAIFTMRKAGCLNPETFRLLLTCDEDSQELSAVSGIIGTLSTAKLLTAANFTQVIGHKEDAKPVANGLLSLGFAGVLNQYSFEKLLTAGEQSAFIGEALQYLADDNLLTPTNFERIFTLGQERDSIHELVLNGLKLLEAANFTPEDGLALQWVGHTPEQRTLSLKIDEMFAYGFNLLGQDDEKAKVVFLLALDLKKSLKTHYSKAPREQLRTEEQFKKGFIALLHTQDEVMSEHREAWKVVVLNVAVAFTLVGILAIAISYATSGHLLWGKTTREDLRDEIQSSPLLEPVC